MNSPGLAETQGALFIGFTLAGMYDNSCDFLDVLILYTVTSASME
jgi:hypothetical protein